MRVGTPVAFADMMERDHKVAIIRLKSSWLTACYSFVIQLSLTFRTASSIAGLTGNSKESSSACLGRARHLHHQPTGQLSP
jgi:hypothetical protein